MPVRCPNCGTKVPVNMLAKLKDKSRLTFEITQEPGHYLSASTLGGLLVENEKLFRALSKQHEARMTLLVEDIYMTSRKTVIQFLLTLAESKKDCPEHKGEPRCSAFTERQRCRGKMNLANTEDAYVAAPASRGSGGTKRK